MRSFSEGQYHLFKDDGTVALTWLQQDSSIEISFYYADKFPIVFMVPHSPCVTNGPSIHAHWAGFSAMDQRQLTGPKEGSLC